MSETLRWAGILEGLRRARVMAEAGHPDPELLRGVVFAMGAEALQLPHGDPMRLKLENGVALLTGAASQPEKLAEVLLRIEESLV